MTLLPLYLNPTGYNQLTWSIHRAQDQHTAAAMGRRDAGVFACSSCAAALHPPPPPEPSAADAPLARKALFRRVHARHRRGKASMYPCGQAGLASLPSTHAGGEPSLHGCVGRRRREDWWDIRGNVGGRWIDHVDPLLPVGFRHKSKKVIDCENTCISVYQID